MFETMKPEPSFNPREIRIEFLEDDPPEPVERPKVKFLFEVRRNHLA